MRSTRQLLGRALLAIAGLAIGLLGCEVIVRLVRPQTVLLWRPGPFIADGEGAFRLRPGHRGTLTNRTEFTNDIRINAAGTRGPELGVPGEDCSILTLGDSFTFGTGVEDDEVFGSRLVDLLRDRGLATRHINGGMPAVGVPQEVRWLERHGLETHPNLVLLAIFIGNDLRDATADYAAWRVYRGQLAPEGTGWGLKEWLYHYSHLYLLVKSATPSALQRRLRAALGRGEPWSSRSARQAFEIYRHEVTPLTREGLETTASALDRLLDLGTEHGFDVFATLVPDRAQVDPSRWRAVLRQLELEAGEHDPQVPNRHLRRLLEDRRIPVLDLTDPLAAAIEQGDAVYFPIDQHWTTTGHDLAARRLSDFLQRQASACWERDPRPTQRSAATDRPSDVGAGLRARPKDGVVLDPGGDGAPPLRDRPIRFP